MRAFGKFLGRLVLALSLAIIVTGVWKKEEITRLWAVNSLFGEDTIIANFSNMDAAFLTTEVPRGTAATSELPHGSQAELPTDVSDWLKDRAVTSLVVLKNGQIVFEDYFQDTTAQDRRISWSVAKSFLSALFGILLEEGVIGSLDDPVTRYVPVLDGTAYDRATLRNVLQMSSGVTFDEDYLDFNSDINRMGRVLALGGRMDEFTAGLTETFAAPGAGWQYVSIDTHVIAMAIRGATGRSIPDLLSEKVISPLGLEQTPYFITDGAGVAFALGGLNLTTRDYARFGQMYLQNGFYNGQQIVPAGWVSASTSATAPTAPGELGYGYHWWVPKGASAGEFMARGIYGQYIYINQGKGVVIASTAADRQFREDGVNDQNIAIFRAIADSF